MTKKELAELVLSEKELKYIDYALPQWYITACLDVCAPDPRPYCVWYYGNNTVAGECLNLAEQFIEKYVIFKQTLVQAKNVLNLEE